MSQVKTVKRTWRISTLIENLPIWDKSLLKSSQGAASFYLRMNWNGKLM